MPAMRLDGIMKLIICESTGEWATAVRRRLPSEVSLVETRSLTEMSERLDESPAAVVAVEWFAGRAEMTLSEITRLGRKYPQAAVVVLADRDFSSPQNICREAGAMHVVLSRRRVSEIIEIIRHRLRSGNWTDQDIDESSSFEDRLLASLPWSH